MSIKTVTAALVLVAATGAAQAQDVNPGIEQLAAQAGVNAADFTVSQLISLQDAIDSNNVERTQFILSQARTQTTRATLTADTTSPAYRQLEAGLGVEPGRFSPAELSQLAAARRSDEPARAAYILSGENRADGADDATNAGKLQLAAALGLNPDDYTLAELTARVQDLND